MPSLVLPLVLLVGSAVAIYFSCELFVNGIEWVGRKLSVGQKATGSVLAAFGTALPESVVTLVAVAFGASSASKELGVGAALGGPLALATIAYAMVGIILLASRIELPKTAVIRSEFGHLARDQGLFLLLFAAKILLGLVAFSTKPWLGIVFVAAYLLYVRAEMRAAPDEDEGTIAPLILARARPTPPLPLCLAQTLAALAVIFVASRLFVDQLSTMAPLLGMRPQLIAMLLSPIATELPETMNAIIWVRQGKHRVALANISGAMMIQATIPTAFGLFWTPWLLSAPLLLAAAMTAIAVSVMLVSFRSGRISRRLLAGVGVLYPTFIALLLVLRL